MRKNIRLVGFGLLILVILLLIVLLISQINKIPAIIEGYSTWLKIGAIIGISCISCVTAQFVLFERHIETPFTPDDENYVNEMYYATAENNNELKKYLQHRYSFFWRRKVRLILVTGDDAAIEQLVPGLRQQRWLEGQRTVLIYGGSLLSEPDSEQYAALRKLRRGRPLDGIVRVMPSSLTLTPQISESDLRGLEKISELLRYAAPVWLWKLCDSEWPQADRAVQAVGVSFPLRATEDDVARQLAQMLPTLREQGMRQIAEETRHDFLLRLGQRLIDGGIAQWRWQLAPWLTASRQRLALRGLMFSLPEPRTVDPYQEADALPANQPHLLTLPATWQGIVDDCQVAGITWEWHGSGAWRAVCWPSSACGQRDCCSPLPLITARLLQSREKPATWWPTPPFLTIN
ncbi:hypothetical protein AE36_01321 [Klebsiella variicola]|nr:hypothetical protein AE36_01321 [Klebsiella variicola]